ncbi:O-acyltransferase WSD [Folsomia candida]|uniref:O-acyltransferase WSD n=1 Tax=Folsomia candida TaxID=158441 RepID=A0A226EWK0_FOLCA|nr:O-acyltransferase WSD [Folsomia candida]
MEFKYHFARVVLQTLTLTMVYIAFHPVSFLIRWILPKIAAFCGKKDYKKLVERSNVPLASLAYVEANSSILVTATVKGPLPLERLKFAFAETVKRPEYEKMTQIPSPFLGYLFWRADDNFKINQHIEEMEISGSKTNRVDEIKNKLLESGYPMGTSPWRIYLLRNTGSGCDTIFFKFHHSLTDGYSLLHLLVYEICNVDDISKTSDSSTLTERKSIFHRIKSCVQYVLLLLQASIMLSLSSVILPEKNPLHHLPREKMCLNSKFHLVSSQTSLQVVKNAKNQWNCSFPAAVLTGIREALRDAMFALDKRNITREVSPVLISIPTWQSSRKGECITMLNSQLKSKRTEAAPMFMMGQIVGGLPSFLLPFTGYTDVDAVTFCYSDFPGPIRPIDIVGQRVISFDFIANLPIGNMGIMLCASSYQGAWKINLLVDAAIIPENQNAQKFVDSVRDSIVDLAIEKSGGI